MRLIAVPALQDNYIWLLADAAGAAIVVDPGASAPVEALLAREKLTLTAILLTHHHPDHIGGVEALARGRQLRIIAPVEQRIGCANESVADGDLVEIEAPAVGLQVLEIPGHTLSHVAYHGEDMLFCGDTLFSLGCGRMFEGTPAQMLASLDRLAALPADTRICCGHEYTLANAAFAREVDPGNEILEQRIREATRQRRQGRPTLPSRLGAERAANPFLRVDSIALRHWAEQDDRATDRVGRFAALRKAKDRFRA